VDIDLNFKLAHYQLVMDEPGHQAEPSFGIALVSLGKAPSLRREVVHRDGVVTVHRSGGRSQMVMSEASFGAFPGSSASP
jgi:hypothetical protein